MRPTHTKNCLVHRSKFFWLDPKLITRYLRWLKIQELIRGKWTKLYGAIRKQYEKVIPQMTQNSRTRTRKVNHNTTIQSNTQTIRKSHDFSAFKPWWLAHREIRKTEEYSEPETTGEKPGKSGKFRQHTGKKCCILSLLNSNWLV